MRSSSTVKIPPPIIYFVALAIGFTLNTIWPLSSSLATWGRIIGVAFIILSIPIMPPVLMRFKRLSTTFDVRKEATTLITDGPFNYSRNPTYVSLTLLFLGIGLILNNMWILILAFPVLAIMDQWVIRGEESFLEETFGEEYLQYKSRVRRWL